MVSSVFILANSGVLPLYWLLNRFLLAVLKASLVCFCLQKPLSWHPPGLTVTSVPTVGTCHTWVLSLVYIYHISKRRKFSSSCTENTFFECYLCSEAEFLIAFFLLASVATSDGWAIVLICNCFTCQMVESVHLWLVAGVHFGHDWTKSNCMA